MSIFEWTKMDMSFWRNLKEDGDTEGRLGMMVRSDISLS